MYDACLFDYGNTIVEFDLPQVRFVEERFREDLCRRCGPVTAEALRAAMDRLYEMPRRGDVPSYRELHPVDQMEILLFDLYGRDGAGRGGRRTREVLEAADDALQEIFIASIDLRPPERAVLERLAQRLPLGLVSNYPSGPALRRSLENLGLDRLFRTVVISGEVGFVKPHRSLFDIALRALETDPARTLFVGDRWDTDLCGARDAGLRTCHLVGFTSEGGFEEKYRLYRPDYVARTLEDVERILAAAVTPAAPPR